MPRCPPHRRRKCSGLIRRRGPSERATNLFGARDSPAGTKQCPFQDPNPDVLGHLGVITRGVKRLELSVDERTWWLYRKGALIVR
jgi:hypothetical protein